jgi:ABC-type multidrug transport system fused ATPase/permease subunit
VRPDGVRPADSDVNADTAVPWRRVFRWLFPYWKAEVALLIAMVAGIGLSLLYPLLLRRIVDDVVSAGHWDRLPGLIGWTLLATGGGLLLSAGAGLLQTWVTARVLIDLRLASFRHVLRLGPAWLAGKRLGDVLTRLGADLADLQRTATGTMLSVLGAGLTLLGVLAALTAIDRTLLLVALTAVPIAIALLRVLRPRLRGLELSIRERSADVSHALLENVSAARSVRAHGLVGRQAGRFLALNEALVRDVLRMRVLDSGSAAGFQLIVLSVLGAVLWVGGARVQQGSLTPGDLLAFLLFLQRLFGPLQGLAGTWIGVQRAAPPIARVFEVLDATPAPAGDALPGDGGIVFDAVSFAHRPGQDVLRAVSFAVPAGTTTVVVGPSGVGKSTLVDVLFGLLAPREGRVLIGGVDVATLREDGFAGRAALVTQQPQLVTGSLRANIAWLKPEIDDAAIQAGLVSLGLGGLPGSLPDGLETPVGDRGMRLSEGQRQRIGLLRAVLADPALLVLDEVTSALDWENDALVQDLLATRRKRGGTTLVISHRLSACVDADEVVLLVDGEVKARGRHADLLASSPLYAQWAEAQRRGTA